MYETPKLYHLGEAENVILGLYPAGNDLDGNYVGGDLEWADDGLDEERWN